jgi:predicted ferric reductase
MPLTSTVASEISSYLAIIATLALIAIVVTSIWRKRLNILYEPWRAALFAWLQYRPTPEEQTKQSNISSIQP